MSELVSKQQSWAVGGKSNYDISFTQKRNRKLKIILKENGMLVVRNTFTAYDNNKSTERSASRVVGDDDGSVQIPSEMLQTGRIPSGSYGSGGCWDVQ